MSAKCCTIRPVLLAGALLLAVGAPVRGQEVSLAADAAAVSGTIERFHAALAVGDSAGALALLAPDAVILESGGLETREEYRSHHLPGDIAFAQAVRTERGPTQVRIVDDVAWAYTTSTTAGTFRDRAINSAGAELVVLRRAGAVWRISAIHWSSRSRRQ